MRQRLSLALAVALLTLGAAPLYAGDSPEQVGEEIATRFHEWCGDLTDQVDYFKDPGSAFYFSADVLVLRRKLTNINFPTTSFGVGGPVIAQLQDLKFDDQPGLQVTAGYRFDQWFSVEGRYFGLQDWSDVVTVTDPEGRLFGVLNKFGTVQQPVFPSPPFPPTFGTGNNTTSQSGGYSSRLNNWEINAICDLVSFDLSSKDGKDNVKFSMSALAGVRYIRLIENFFVSTKGDIIPAAGIDDPGAFTDYNINATNNFFGGQLGGRFTLTFWDRLDLELDAKAGLLADGAKQQSAVTFLFNQPFPIPGFISGSGNDLRTTTLGELNASAVYDLTSHIKVRAGYEIMWLNGRALAPDQIDTGVAQTNTLHPILNDRGTTMFYGFYFGGEVNF